MQPKFYSPIPSQLGTLHRWHGCLSSRYKLMNRKNDFQMIIFRVETLHSVALNLREGCQHFSDINLSGSKFIRPFLYVIKSS